MKNPLIKFIRGFLYLRKYRSRSIRKRELLINLSSYCAGQFFFEVKEKLPKKKPFYS